MVALRADLVLASVLGVAVVLPIGGADIPVVISMLNAAPKHPRGGAPGPAPD